MNRIAFAFLIAIAVSSPALAIELFHKHWKEHYLTDKADKLFVKRARQAGCYLCHVKRQKKRDVQNEYGSALARHLDANDFPEEWVDANPEEAKKRILAAFEKVEDEFASDDRRFGEKIDAGELPASNSGL